MIQPERLILDIEQIITHYSENSATIPLDRLLVAQDKLSGYSFAFAELVANAKQNHNNQYFKKKVAINRGVQHLVASGIEKAVNKATSKVEVQNEDLLQAELDAEALTFKYDLKLKQINKVLQAMQQRISFVKKEWELSQFQTNTQA